MLGRWAGDRTDVPRASHGKGLCARCWCFLVKPKSSCGQSLCGARMSFCSVPALHFSSDADFESPSSFCLLPSLGTRDSPRGPLCWSCCILHQPHSKRSHGSSRTGCRTDVLWGWCRGWVEGSLSSAGSSSAGCRWEGSGWPRAVWMLSRG